MIAHLEPAHSDPRAADRRFGPMFTLRAIRRHIPAHREIVRRLDEHRDLFAPVLSLRQGLPVE